MLYNYSYILYKIIHLGISAFLNLFQQSYLILRMGLNRKDKKKRPGKSNNGKREYNIDFIYLTFNNHLSS